MLRAGGASCRVGPVSFTLGFTATTSMTRRIFLLATAVFFAKPVPVLAQGEPKPGSFGFAIEVDGDGFFLNPTLKSVTIKSVASGRPASDAGIKPGDQIIEVEGKQISGAKARDLEPHLKKNVGEKLNLRLRRPNGEFYSTTLAAAPKAN